MIEDKPSKKSQNIGLQQTKIPFLKPRDRVAIPMLRTKSFIVNPEVTHSIASGSIILSIGIIIGLSLPSLNFNEKYNFSASNGFQDTPNPMEGIVILMLQFFFGFALSGLESEVSSSVGIEELLLPLIFGWFIGGIVAAIVYDDKGKNGPYYSSIIAISLSLGLSMIIGIIAFLQTGKISNDLSAIFIPFFGIILITLAIAVLSVPLIIVAYVGYTIGGKINE